VRIQTLWYIVTPVYWPAPGGGAVYTRLLAEALAGDGVNVVVETEAFGGEPLTETIHSGRGTVVINRIYPMRAGRPERDWRSYVSYVRQNAQMLFLPQRVARAVRATASSRAIVLFHSSFFYKPSLMPLAVRQLKQFAPVRTRLIIDVRDQLFDDSLSTLFRRFDAAIGSSRLVATRLRTLLPDAVDVAHIPIPFRGISRPDPVEVTRTLREYGLDEIPYLLNPNGINEDKRYPEMLEVVRELRRMPGYEKIMLVTIGRSRDWKARDDWAVKDGILKYLGVVPNPEALCLISGAKAVIVLSLVESPSRSILESLALSTPVIAPPVPEFIETIPSSVVLSTDAREIAHQVNKVINGSVEEEYPLATHSPASLLTAYRKLEDDHKPPDGSPIFLL
jgi:glycosyltransferase involved in cell wall biosynthesis